jgi:hypothetical protein
MNAHSEQRFADRIAIRFSDKANEDDIATQLAKDARDIASLPARLRQDRPAALNFSSFEVFDL